MEQTTARSLQNCYRNAVFWHYVGRKIVTTLRNYNILRHLTYFSYMKLNINAAAVLLYGILCYCVLNLIWISIINRSHNSHQPQRWNNFNDFRISFIPSFHPEFIYSYLWVSCKLRTFCVLHLEVKKINQSITGCFDCWLLPNVCHFTFRDTRYLPLVQFKIDVDDDDDVVGLYVLTERSELIDRNERRLLDGWMDGWLEKCTFGA